MRGTPHTAIDLETHRMIRIEDLDTVCDNLKAIFDEQKDTNDWLRKRLDEITDEKWKDKELQEMKAQMEKYHHKAQLLGFCMTDNDQSRIQEWKDKHMAEQHNIKTLEDRLRWGGSIGGNFLYEFCPTSIGTIGTCVCGNCRAKAFAKANGDYQRYKELLREYDAEFEFQELN